MKKLLFIFAIAAVGSLASCKKDYTCTCTADGDSISHDYEGVKKGDAEDTCDAQETTYKAIDPEVTCSLD